jgi:hypothetical protein
VDLEVVILLSRVSAFWEEEGHFFSELTQAFCKHHEKTQNDEQIYLEMKNMKQKEIERVEVYYERIQKLVHGLQILTIDSFLTIVFRVGL